MQNDGSFDDFDDVGADTAEGHRKIKVKPRSGVSDDPNRDVVPIPVFPSAKLSNLLQEYSEMEFLEEAGGSSSRGGGGGFSSGSSSASKRGGGSGKEFLTLTCQGTLDSLRYVAVFYATRKDSEKKYLRENYLDCGTAKRLPSFVASPTGAQGGRASDLISATTLDVLAITHELELKEAFRDTSQVFYQRFLGAKVSWPFEKVNMESHARILHRAFYQYQSRQPMEAFERQMLEKYFFGNILAGSADMTHSVAPGQQAEQQRRVRAHENSRVHDLNFKQSLEVLDPFVAPSWEPDEARTVCPDCNRTFTKMWIPQVWASHCRVCGKKKCTDCTKYRVDRKLAKLAREDDGPRVKACQGCSDNCSKLMGTMFLSHVFAFCGMNVIEISLMQLVNEQFRLAAQCCLDQYKAIYNQPLLGLGALVARDPGSLTTTTTTTGGGGSEYLLAGGGHNRSFASSASHFGTNGGSSDATPGSFRYNAAGLGNAVIEQRGMVAGISRTVASMLYHSDQLLVGHCPAVVAFSSTLDWSIETEARKGLEVVRNTFSVLEADEPCRKVAHWHLLCTRTCNTRRPEFFAIQILQIVNGVASASDSANECRRVAGMAIKRHFQVKKKHPDLVQKQTATLWAIAPLIVDLYHEAPREQTKELILELSAQSEQLAFLIFIETLARIKSEPPGSALHSKMESLHNEVEALSTTSSTAINQKKQPSSSSVNPPSAIGEESPTATVASTPSSVPSSKIPPASLASPSLSAVKDFVEMLDDFDQKSAIPGEDHNTQRAFYMNLDKRKLIRFDSEQQADRLRADWSTCLPDKIELKPMPFLFNLDVTITALELKTIAVLSSQQKPLLITLLDAEGGKHPILYKPEDVRKDYVVCSTIHLLESILRCEKKKSNMGRIPKYRVLPIGKDAGIIEIAKGAKTMEKLRHRTARETVNTSVTGDDGEVLVDGNSFTFGSGGGYEGGGGGGNLVANYSLARNHHDQSVQKHPVAHYLHSLPETDELKHNFKDSASFYTFITYVLGVADRHRDNVMVCEDGAILHIDFGFIISERPTTEKFTSRYVRFDDDLIECVKAFYPSSSMEKRLDLFLRDSAELLCLLRPHSDVITLLLQHLVARGAVRENPVEICEFVTSRMMVGRSDTDAKEEFVKRVKNSMGDPLYQDRLHEIAQDIKQKGFVASLVDNFTW